MSGIHPSPGAGEVAATFAMIARDLMSRGSVQDTLEGIAHSAVAVVTGCDWAGVMTVQGGGVESPAVTDPVVNACDAAQKRAGEGPCLQVLGHREPLIRVDDLAADPRWRVFGPAAVRLGIGSMLSCELSAGPRDSAALNLYAGRPHAFDEEAEQLGQIFAIHASMAGRGPGSRRSCAPPWRAAPASARPWGSSWNGTARRPNRPSRCSRSPRRTSTSACGTWPSRSCSPASTPRRWGPLGGRRPAAAGAE